MSHRCLTPEDLEALRALPRDDARRREAEACPRCRGLLESYAEFLDDRSVPGGADPARAAARLGRAFEDALGPEPARPAPVPLRPRARPAWPAPRLAWAAAAAVVVLAGAYAGSRWLARDAHDTVLRTAPGAEGRERPEAHAARVRAGGVALAWTPVRGADGYRVVFLDDGLAKLAELGPLADTSVVLAAGALPAGLAPGATVAWRIEALQAGRVIGTSATTTLRLP